MGDLRDDLNYMTDVRAHVQARLGDDRKPQWEFLRLVNAVNGHCTFTSARDLAGLDAMVDWLDSGHRPEPEAFFPATLGFLPGFVPAPWPW